MPATATRIDDCLSIRDAHLWIEECDAVELARRFGTPAYVVSEAQLRRNARRIAAAFAANWPGGDVALLPSLKANLSLALRRVLNTEGLGCDTFGPTGPWLVTKDEIPDPQNLAMWLDVDGERMQDGNTKTMIFNVAKVVSYVSQCMSLQPGDVISTGTPPGVGMGVKPNPVFLKPGQTVRLGIEGLGEQTQRVVAFAP